MITVVFRNTTGYPVNVQVVGNPSSGTGETLYTGSVSGLSGVFTLATGYASYTCNVKPSVAPGTAVSIMRLPPISRSSNVTVVFQQASGAQQ